MVWEMFNGSIHEIMGGIFWAMAENRSRKKFNWTRCSVLPSLKK